MGLYGTKINFLKNNSGHYLSKICDLKFFSMIYVNYLSRELNAYYFIYLAKMLITFSYYIN